MSLEFKFLRNNKEKKKQKTITIMYITQSNIFARVDIFLNNFTLYAFLKETQCMLFNSEWRSPHSFEPL